MCVFKWPERSVVTTGIVKALCEAIAKNCPKAWVAIISNPVNSTVPIAAEVFKRYATLTQVLMLQALNAKDELAHV